MISQEKLEEGLPLRIQELVKSGNVRDLLADTDKKPVSLRNALRTANILTCLSHGIDSVTDIAEFCKLNKATVHGLLQVLCEARLTRQDPVSHRYYIGQLITEIASNPYVIHEHLISCSINEMRSLSNLTGETVGLGILVGLDMITLYEIPSTHDLKIVGKKKMLRAPYAGASGKSLLAQLSNKELKIVLTNMMLEPITELTTTRKDQLVAQLKQIREQGYAVSYGERIPGAVSISIPIKNYILPAALSILGPEGRIKPQMDNFINALMAGSVRIQQNLKMISKVK